MLTIDECAHFRRWLNLNLDGLTWQGRFRKEFESFWEIFFTPQISLLELSHRFYYAHSEVKIGALSSWFLWLRDKFISYLFIFKNFSIEELALELEMPAPLIATILRNFFVDEFPHLDPFFSERFQVGNILSPNQALRFLDLKMEIQIPTPEFGSHEDEIMPSMEVTLYDEWSIFLKRMKQDFKKENLNFFRFQKKTSFLQQIKIFQEVAILFFLFIVVAFSVRNFNIWYEKYLMEKVSVYEPKFTWPRADLMFKSQDLLPAKEFNLNFDNIKDVSKGEKLTEFFDPEKYEEETEVTLSSFDSIPKDLSIADKESSVYEGDSESANGYRETKGGTTKIYRLMMSSVDIYRIRNSINLLMKDYKIEPVGDSVPGLDVPGGVYYNLYIPRKELKDFLSRTMKLDNSKLFESSTSNVKSVPGKIRVFIMLKSI